MLNNAKSRQYINGLDGLRALSVLAVIAYHLNLNGFRGGFLGVNIFFVLSGYLITNNILLSLYENSFNIKEFWIKRVRRLIPAAYTMIISVLIGLALFDAKSFTKFILDGVSSLFYTTNWWFIFHKVSYFDSFGSPSPFKNLWSLAIEEQFYIVWPVILILGIKAFKTKIKLAKVIFIMALCSAILMAILYTPGGDPSRIYYGTDTRAFELLMGSCLAIVLPIKKFSNKQISVRKTLNIISLISFIIFILSVVLINEYQTFIYTGGTLLFSFNTLLLIICVCNPNSFLNHLLSLKPLRFIGKRSYGIYLWHYPIIVLSTPVNEIGNPSYLRIGLQITFTFIIAELSYNFIELPIQKYGFKKYFKKYFGIYFLNAKGLSFTRKISTVSALIAVCIIIIINSTFAIRANQHSEKLAQKPENTLNASDTSLKKDLDSSTTGDEKSNGLPAVKNKKSYDEILVIGDSILLDIESTLKNKYSNIIIDGKIERQMYQAIDLAPRYASFNKPNKAVIIELGTNAYFTDKQIDTLLQAFSKTHIYLVNVRVPRQWESLVNKSLSKKANEYDNVFLIDWHSAAINHPEYFASDGVHLELNGINALTTLISESLESDNKTIN